jgi:NhaA family Na+:H+ antiporter
MRRRISRFLEHDAAGSVLLIGAAGLALLLANSPLAGFYRALFEIEVEVRVAEFQVLKPLLLWINDGLMAIFFFTVGLELKREVLGGELSTPSQVALPAFGALGGMIAPAAFYAWINWGDPVAMRGWAIPTATDIAFALGVLMLLGKSVPTSLKLFLVTLAIVDDIGAIVIIALFYTADLAPLSLALAGVCLVVLFALNRLGVEDTAPYVLVGILMWLSVLKSGVHATLAGVLLAMFIPYRTRSGESPLRELETGLHATVSLAVLPLFALANCGVTLIGTGHEALFAPVPLGVAAGLVLGKPLGVLLFSGIAIALGLARLPERSNLTMFVGVACLTGIGFTMSLFIGSLAFEHADPGYGVDERTGILLGSIVSAVLGLTLLRLGLRRFAPVPGNAP